MKDAFQRVKASWNNALHNQSFRWQFFLTLLVFLAVSQHNFHFLNLWEAREGIRLNDPVLRMLPPQDFSNIIFFFTYSAILFVMVATVANPGRFVRGLQAYSLIVALRTATIYFFPMEAPAGFVPLTDPVIDFLLNKDVVVTKDLFFSGHTATLAFIFLMAQGRYLKTFCFIALIVAPVLLMWQHVHYTIDVVCAPLVAYFALTFVNWVSTRYEYGKVLYKY
jgi:hypothetical protein